MTQHRFGSLARRVLEQAAMFDVVLSNGVRWPCRLLECGEHELLVETYSGTFLLPGHSILYIILTEEQAGPVPNDALAEIPRFRSLVNSDHGSLSAAG